jgi:hypothetical protein
VFGAEIRELFCAGQVFARHECNEPAVLRQRLFFCCCSQYFVTCGTGSSAHSFAARLGGSPHVTARSTPPQDHRFCDRQHLHLGAPAASARRRRRDDRSLNSSAARSRHLADYILGTYAVISGSLPSRIRATHADTSRHSSSGGRFCGPCGGQVSDTRGSSRAGAARDEKLL